MLAFTVRSMTFIVRNMTVVVHSYDVFYHLILSFDKGLSVLNFPLSSVFLWFYFLHYIFIYRLVTYLTKLTCFLKYSALAGVGTLYLRPYLSVFPCQMSLQFCTTDPWFATLSNRQHLILEWLSTLYTAHNYLPSAK